MPRILILIDCVFFTELFTYRFLPGSVILLFRTKTNIFIKTRRFFYHFCFWKVILTCGYRNIAGSYLTAHISLIVLEPCWEAWISSFPQWFVNTEVRAGLLDYFDCTWILSTLESLYLTLCKVNLDALNTTDTTTWNIMFGLLSWDIPAISIKPSTQLLLVTIFYMQVFYKETFTPTISTGHQPVYSLFSSPGSHQLYQIRLLHSYGYVAYLLQLKTILVSSSTTFYRCLH